MNMGLNAGLPGAWASMQSQARLQKLGARERNTNEGPHVQGPHFIPRQESP